MAHFAEINDKNIVVRVLVVPDEQEHRGADYLVGDLYMTGTWLQTSISGKIRKNFAHVGDSYDPIRDAFIPYKKFASWVLDEETCRWIPPSQSPAEGYVWDEGSKQWICTVCTD